jgi:hypothetical protein
MGKKSSITQEVVNSFPKWSKIRNDPDSTGQRIINSFCNEIEELEKVTQRIEKNNHLSTVNLDEIDQIYSLALPTTFAFLEASTDVNLSGYTPPTSISGELSISITPSLEDAPILGTGAIGTSLDITLIEDGDIKTFWENSDPDSVTLGETVSISKEVHQIIDVVKLDTLGTLDHPMRDLPSRRGGRFHFTLTAGYPYIRKEEGSLLRSRIVISGETRKGTFERETLVFPWEDTVATKKEWSRITSIIPYDVVMNLTPIQRCGDASGNNVLAFLSIYGDNSLTEHEGDYASLSNLRTSVNRNKIDEFWGLLNGGILERAEHATDNYRLLMRGHVDKISKDRWDLLDKDGVSVSPNDIELIPFKDKFWAVDDNNLYLYSLTSEDNKGIERLKDNPDAQKLEIKMDTEDLVIGEKASISLFLKRSTRAIRHYTLEVEKPTVPTPTVETLVTSNISTVNEKVLYNTELDISLNGGYILKATAIYSDDSTETVTKLFTVKSKTPIKTFPLKGAGLDISGTPTGLFLDSDQKLWVKTDVNFYEIKPHKNLALIDYKRKIVYLHQNYTGLIIDYPSI